MNQQTIDQLNQINKTFYEKVGQSFSETRQEPWEGWKLLLPTFEHLPKQATVLDVGCGNGRFAQFIFDQFPNNEIQYIGIDNSQFLLDQARIKLNSKNAQFQVADIVSNTLSISNFEKYDAIVMFGVLHHIPSFKLRQQILQNLFNLLQPNGILIFSAWQFLTIPNLVKRISNWDSQKNIDQHELEEGDYLLDWQRDTQAFRYCHQVSQSEIEQLTQLLQYMKVEFFTADGKNNRTNIYTVITNHA